MAALSTPLTLQTAVTSWRFDLPSSILVVLVVGIYLVGLRRSTVPSSRAVPVLIGAAVWLIAGCGFVGVYSDVLFWVRALQVVLLLMVVPFCLALGMPGTMARDIVGHAAFDRVLGSKPARVLASPATTSAGIIVTPWLIYLTGWYPAMLQSGAVDTLTRLLLVICGAGYFYTRLQLDPVPRRYPQSMSLLITLGETLGDGVLGVVMWQGGLLAASYYEALHRVWGPSLRTDQTIGAGVFWILGDALGLPFLLVLFSRFRADERLRAEAADAELDAAELKAAELAAAEPIPRAGEGAIDSASGSTTLWWESHPELRDRFR
ncbi:cytochrome c oxidase assembly protein [Gordonia sp. DT219]|uniref:cytochrome c oxidase assembly protein n=1 Tax=Gordonia sp. DT219 TaxID=3416658 RepID=UPI003CEB821F